jgi:hypothetical protein
MRAQMCGLAEEQVVGRVRERGGAVGWGEREVGVVGVVDVVH